MGGTGSGRRGNLGGRHLTTDRFRSIDVRVWEREGYLQPGRSFVWPWLRHGKAIASIGVLAASEQVTLTYMHRSAGDDWRKQTCVVELAFTSCHLGGQRTWFLCPSDGCGRRVAILYGGAMFACRQCFQLAYPSQRERAETRAIHRADKIRERLGWEPGIINGMGPKPKGMHRDTFEQLTAQHDAFVQKALAETAERLNLQYESAHVSDWSREPQDRAKPRRRG